MSLMATQNYRSMVEFIQFKPKQEKSMEKYNWSQLHRMRLGRYAEYFAKMEFTQFNFDVYTSEVDN